MNNLANVNQTIDTREIADMMDTTHDKILRKLEGDKSRKGIIAILTDAQMGVSDYFIESSYIDVSGKENKCYKCTKMGCEFLANKFTGEKGILFTAKYVKRFNEMEQRQAIPQIDSKFLFQLAQSLEAKETEIKQLNTENDLLAKKQLEWTTRQTILAIIRKIGGKYDYQDAWRMFKAQLLYKHNIDINHRHTLAKKNAKNKSKIKTMDMLKAEELNDTLSTATALARSLKVDITSIIDKTNE